MELEQAYLGMDTAIPLGIIVNELFSNSLKHSFPGGKKGQTSLILKSVENLLRKQKIPGLEENAKYIGVSITCSESVTMEKDLRKE